MSRRGRELEELVALIERHLNGTDGVSVQSPLFLPDFDNGELREHDVVVLFEHDHHEIRVALECRDRKSKVDSAAVEAFSAKCRATGIHSGIMVSSSGFTRPAIAKAARKNIRCLTLAQAEQFDWIECAGFWFVQPEIVDGLLECIGTDSIAKPYTVFCEDGTEFTGRHAKWSADRELSKILGQLKVGGPHNHCFIYGPQPGYVIDAQGKRQDIKGMKLWISYKMEKRLLPLQLYRYADSETGEITSAATAKFKIGEISAQLMMLKKPDEDISVTITHGPA